MVGFLDITFGPMFSGKTTNLLEKINNFLTYNKIKKIFPQVLVINHAIDQRNITKIGNLTTHESSVKRGINSDNVKFVSAHKLIEVDPNLITEAKYIAIDESQFYEDLEIMVRLWLKKDKYIHCVGLVADSEKNNFGQLHKLFALADNVEHLKAYCAECNSYEKNAVFTKWVAPTEKQGVVSVGSSDNYIPVCGKHY